MNRAPGYVEDIADLTEVIQRVQQGDERAQNRLFSAYSGYVHQVVRSVLHNHHDSEEVTQDIMLKVLQKAHQFDGNSRFTTWLYRIALNQAISFTRSAAFKLNQRSDNWEEHGDRAAEPEADPSEWEQQRWEQVMQSLQPEERAMLVMRYTQGLPILEVAKICSTSEGALKVRLYRLNKRLREQFEGKNEEE